MRRGSVSRGKAAIRIEEDFLAWERKLNVTQDLTLKKIWAEFDQEETAK